MQVVRVDHQDVLNAAAKLLARTPGPARHGETEYCDAWRFPLVEGAPLDVADANTVTFVVIDPTLRARAHVIGTFGRLYERVELERVTFAGEPMPYLAASVVVPFGQVHRYVYAIDGARTVDSINPQRVRHDDGTTWARFFTDGCTQPLELEAWEFGLLSRLTNHVLPFRTAGAQAFLAQFPGANELRLDEPVGAASFIDKLIARSERHHLVDYKLCLSQIAAVLRRRLPGFALSDVPRGAIVALYRELATDRVEGWDTRVFGSPAYFLQVLRRHTWIGAFGHPRHGGNIDGVAWAYLEDTYRGARGESCFAWRDAIEAPLGTSED